MTKMKEIVIDACSLEREDARRALPRAKRIVPIPEQDMKVLTGIVNGLEPAVAVVEAGFTVSSKIVAQKIGESIWERHASANETFAEALRQNGADLPRLAEKMSKLMEAKTYINVKGKLTPVPDNSTQLRATQFIIEAGHGAAAPKQTITTELSFEARLLQITMMEEQ